MEWFKRLFCNHSYTKVSENMIHAGMGNLITLQCHYCGNEDNKFSMTLSKEEMENMTIKCKCGKWLVRNGIMGHKNNDY